MRQRLARYVLLYMVGPFMAEWWAACFTVGYGLALLVNIPDALGMGLYRGFLTAWFAPFTQVFALCLVLIGLMTLEALHRGKRWLFLCMTVLNMLAMLWIAVFFLIAIPSPTHAVWVYLSHSVLQGLIYARSSNRIEHFWYGQSHEVEGSQP